MQPASNILLIDDDFDDRFLIGEAFMSTGLNVHISEATSGIQAVEMIRSMQNLPGLILVDMNMPGMDGIETIQHIRLIDPNVPVVLLTTSLTPNLADQAMCLGADACFGKPIPFQDMCSMASQLCKRFLPE